VLAVLGVARLASGEKKHFRTISDKKSPIAQILCDRIFHFLVYILELVTVSIQ
jgi:hypothetical protein